MPKWVQPPLPARFSDVGHPIFVGRTRQLEALDAIWTRAESGERQAVFVTGEPGSGKTRLASFAAQALHKEGCTVLLGSSSQDLGYPYKPLVEALDSLLASASPGDFDDILPASVAELVRIVPGLERHLTPSNSPPASNTEYRRELFSAYVDMIRAITDEDRPLALFLEDLHWSSPPTIELLSYLVQSTDSEKLLIFVTSRNNAPDRSDELTFAIADLYRLPGVERIDLSGLDTGEIEDYLLGENPGDTSLGKDAAALLKDHTGGNPFFLRELLRDILDLGGVQAFKAGKISAPASVRDSLENRFQSFGEEALLAIEFAAVMGDSFEPEILAEASGLDRTSLLEALDGASDYGLIRPGAEPGTLEFQHTLIRQAVLDRLKPSRSAKIHADIAGTLSRRYQQNSILAPIVARLYLGALTLGYESEAVSYLSIAARQAESGLAHEEAATLWQTAAGVHKGDRPDMERFLLAAAQAHVKASNFDQGVQLFAELARSHDPTTALMAAIGHEGATWRTSQEGATGRDLLLHALEQYGVQPEDPLYVRGVGALGRAHVFAGDMDLARSVGEKAIEMARGIGDDRTTTYVIESTLLHGFSPAKVHLLSERAAELRGIGRRRGYYDCLGAAASIRSTIGLMRGDRSEWEAGGEDLRFMASKTGERFWGWVGGLREFHRLYMDASFHDASLVAQRLNREGQALGADAPDGPYGLSMYLVKRETGELTSIRPLISGDPKKDGTWEPGLLSLYTELGMKVPAKKMLWRLLRQNNQQQKQTAVWSAIIAFLSEAAIALADTEAMELIFPDLLEYDGFNLVPGVALPSLGSANRYIAQFYEALGSSDLAREHFAKALLMDIKTGSVLHRAETLARFATFLARSGRPDDVEESEKHHRSAFDLADANGQRRVLEMLGVVPSDLPDGLTPRELEVLKLLAKGASNQEIAGELLISPNTAANHVRSILIKTMSPNRTRAAVYATEHRLL